MRKRSGILLTLALGVGFLGIATMMNRNTTPNTLNNGRTQTYSTPHNTNMYQDTRMHGTTGKYKVHQTESTLPDIAVDQAKVDELVKANCIGCHGGNLEGGFGPNLQKVGAKLNDVQIYDTIVDGRGSMPSYKDKLSNDEIVMISKWLGAKK